MSVTLQTLLTRITDKTRNSTTGALDNNKRTRAINEVLEDLQDYADWDFTKRTKRFYFIDGVYEYSLKNYVGCVCNDSDGSTEIADFKNPYDLRLPDDSHIQFGFRDVKDVRDKIRKSRTTNEYGIDNDLLVINYYRQTSAQLHNCDSLTANGTPAVSGDASNLTVDDVEYKEGSASLNFDSAGTSLVLTFTGINAKNLAELKNKSHLLLKAHLPTITNFTSIKVRWGSDASNYWEKTETTPAGNQTLAASDWQTWAFRWADATETGSPDETALDYIQITITYSASTTDTDFRIDDIRIGQEVEMDLDYYSLAMVQDSSDNYQLEFNSDSVTTTDKLLGASVAKKTVIQGATHELFDMIGGKREKDTDLSLQKYNQKKIELFKRAGHKLRKPSKVLNFQRR